VAIVAVVDFASLSAFGSDAIDQVQHVLMVPADSFDCFFTHRWHGFIPFRETLLFGCTANARGGAMMPNLSDSNPILRSSYWV
jgi:hypothetical protein